MVKTNECFYSSVFVLLVGVSLEVYITLIQVKFDLNMEMWNVLNSLCLNLTIQRILGEKKEFCSR